MGDVRVSLQGANSGWEPWTDSWPSEGIPSDLWQTVPSNLPEGPKQAPNKHRLRGDPPKASLASSVRLFTLEAVSTMPWKPPRSRPFVI